MHLTGFFRVTWIVQLAVGVALFGVSLLIENRVLHAFFAAPVIALTLAIALELGKAAAIVWHRYLSLSAAAAYPWATRAFSAAFRVGLVGLSVLCSVLYLGEHLDRPHLAAVRNADLQAIETRLAEDLARLSAERQTRAATDQARREAEYADARRDHQGQVQELESLLRAEMDHVVGGVFKGPRYQELAARLTAAQAARDGALAALSARHRQEAADPTPAREYAQLRATLLGRAQAQQQAVREASYDGDDRTHDPRVVTLIRLAAAVFDRKLTAPQFVFGFSLFLSLLVELGILLAFDTVTLAVIPALATQHREAVLRESLLAEVAGSAERDGIRHRQAMDRVRQGADRVVERAQATARRAA
ncbi:hypothetical protein [uncultured Thiodictyon sp.]|uniref:hypothetical protein n=1 Tax=uncultured Thiodictyon sp. TaxID=1846217 RepID=UPI0025D74ECC|nr:hypothetical protein [uncultured Thiodictyon sp.]